MHTARHRWELELKLIMRRAAVAGLWAAMAVSPGAAIADDTVPGPSVPEHHVPNNPPGPQSAKPAAAAVQSAPGPRAEVGPVAVTAKRIRPRLDLRLSSDRLHRVLDESGVEPIPESDTSVDTVEVTAHHVQQEPIPQGIPALYYGITHPTEAWRIFAPIQP